MPAAVLLLALAQCTASPERFQDLERSGQEAFVRRDFARAVEYLRQAVCYAPANPRAWHELGLAQAASGDFAAADASLTKAARLAPRDPGILVGHAQVQLSLGQPDRARVTLHGASAAPQVLAPLYIQLGRAYVERKELEPALASFLRAQQAGALDVETLLLLATIENSLGAYADAAASALPVLDAGSPASDAQKGAAAAIAGLAYKNQKRFEDAIRLLDQANRLVHNPTGYLALAEIYESMGKPAEATRVLRDARAVLPDSAAIGVALGRNLIAAGDNSAAADVLTRVTQQSPGEAEAWHRLAEARIALGQGRAAIAALQELVRREPGYPMIDVMLAQAYLKSEPVAYENALRMLDRAEQTSPEDPDVYYLRGKIYAEQGRPEDAVAPLRHAIELAPTAATSYYQLGLVYRKLNRPADAAREFERFNFFKRPAP
jgi:tetratricopeptide (TPR) repeat protein